MMPNSEGSGNVVSVGDLGVGVHHGGGGDMNNSVNGGCDGNGGESNLKKGPWTAEEDAVLVEYVRKHGEGNWNAVQRHSELARCGKSCRLRWANHLRPNLKKGSFSPEEERLIVELHAKFGNKWARMASLLPGRTDNEIKNYWNTRVKRHQRQGLPLYPPDVQPQHPPSPHFHHHHHSPSPPISAAAPMPTSSFTFQTQFSNSSTPITPTSATPPPLSPATTSNSFPILPLFYYSQPSPHHHHHHHSTPTTPTSSFSFPTQQLHSPNNNRTPSTPPPLSPLSSPSTNPNSSFPTLPLLDFNAHRTPPILQSPIRFKRFASNPDISNLHHHHHHHQSPPDHMNNNFSLLSQMGNHQHQHHQLPNFSNYGGNDFHSELQKENQEMCSLLASVTQQQQSPELPLNHFLSGRNLGMGVNNGSSKIGRRMSKRKYFKEKVNGKLGITLMEELLQECGNTNTNTDHNNNNNNSLINLQDHNNFPSNWDHPIANSLAFSSEKGGEEEMMNTTIMAEDLQKVLNRYSIPTMQQEGELYSESADMSNGQSSVVTTDENNNIGGGGGYNLHEMQHIASMFPPVVAEHDVRNLASCSWDNLPGIC